MPVELESAAAWRPPPHPPLDLRTVHVWRVALDDEHAAAAYWPLLSEDEQARARRFYKPVHRDRYVIAHGALRRILASYAGEPEHALRFITGPHGKPALATRPRGGHLEFNLSHSDELALVAVARGGAVGVDLERWSEETEHLELAERFFSPAEREALQGLSTQRDQLVAGFFAAWSRKEAYLKATGFGISRGLHHFDVSLEPDRPARLVQDRLDEEAVARWAMTALRPAERYSAAVVASFAFDEVLQFDAGTIHEQGAELASTAVNAARSVSYG